jgi:di/tricarboxylate transporter
MKPVPGRSASMSGKVTPGPSRRLTSLTENTLPVMGGVGDGVKVLVGGACVNVLDGVSVSVGRAVRDGIGVAVKRGVMLTIGASVAVGGSGSAAGAPQAASSSAAASGTMRRTPDRR